METGQVDAVNEIDLSKYSQAELEALQEQLEDDQEDELEDQLEKQYGLSQETQEAYGIQDKEDKPLPTVFLMKAAFESKDTLRTTFLHPEELGRPHFPVRTYLDFKSVSEHYLNDILIKLGMKPSEYNGIANYFDAKVKNITDSGMSNKGFIPNLVVTQKRDISKQRVKPEELNIRKRK